MKVSMTDILVVGCLAMAFTLIDVDKEVVKGTITGAVLGAYVMRKFK